MKPYTNEEYVEKLKIRNALPFIEDCKMTLAEIYELIDPQRDDETPRQYGIRRGRARSDLTRLLLRIQDGQA